MAKETKTSKKYDAWRRMWHSTGAWRHHSLEEFIRQVATIMIQIDDKQKGTVPRHKD